MKFSNTDYRLHALAVCLLTPVPTRSRLQLDIFPTNLSNPQQKAEPEIHTLNQLLTVCLVLLVFYFVVVVEQIFSWQTDGLALFETMNMSQRVLEPIGVNTDSNRKDLLFFLNYCAT